jgi:hypothetical protein
LFTVKIPTSIDSKGQLLSYQTWVLSKGTDGRLITYQTDNLTGITNSFGITQFERGDPVQFKLNPKIFLDNEVSNGDTIGSVISNEIIKDLERLRGELETNRALLAVQTSSEKESVIDVERKRLEFAKKEFEEQIKIYNRQKSLFEKELISQEDFETTEARYELSKINISIAEERLKTVLSGAKKEEIELLNSQIKAIEREIDILQFRFEKNNITVPISGMIIRPFSSDTLVIVNDTSKKVILIPVKWSESMYVFIDQEVIITSPEVSEKLIARVSSIDNSVKTMNNEQYVIITAVSENPIRYLKTGLYVEAKFLCLDKTMYNIFVERIEHYF